jgi:DNA-binding XRE family transcriptional regulator
MNKPDIVYKRKSRQDFLKDVVGDLVDLRHKRGMTQEEVNHKIGVADRLVSKWECGIRTPTSFNLYCWADALAQLPQKCKYVLYVKVVVATLCYVHTSLNC